jgi:putative alpha-1,2-mannosidase
MVPYNIKGLIDIIGGSAEAEKRLDEYFSRLDAGYGDEWFASGNEPSWGIPWVYNWTGSPWKTQQVVARTLREQYTDRENGLPGNDDLGSMGAWYVFASMGLYPEIPAVAGFSINTPVFPRITIHLPKSDIIIEGGSEQNIYTTSLRLNDAIVNGTWIPWEDICNGAHLLFRTSKHPDKKWGTKVLPPSFE